jgi:Zn-dependent protease with chaperone function
MHLLMILITLGLAWSIRLVGLSSQGNWAGRWQRSLFLFVFPPLLLLMTAVAVLCMGYQGQMLGLQASWFSYILAITWSGFASFLLLKLTYQAWLSRQQIRTYPQQLILGKVARILETNFPYIAQIGLWQPELVISQGLLKTLDKDHLEAVLAHEQVHYSCRDTFWFFWLGWLRSLSQWLPQTETLWQELLLLREIRADLQATQQVDALVLAESLLLVVQDVNQFSQLHSAEGFCAAFNQTIPHNRLLERIDALLTETETFPSGSWWNWSWLILTFLPLVTILLHY